MKQLHSSWLSDQSPMIAKAINQEKLLKLEKVEQLIQRWSTKSNLVSEQDLNDVFLKHIVDSIQPLVFLRKGQGDAIDLGSGIGFPVIPLSICLPNWNFTAVERRSRRCTILRNFARELQLTNLTVLESDLIKVKEKKYDLVTSRALSSLENDWKRAQKLLSEDGLFITFKNASQISTNLPKSSKVHNYFRGREKVPSSIIALSA